jgi:hypothetical protein
MSEMRHGRSTGDSGHRATSSHTGAARQRHPLDDLDRTTRSRTPWATRSIVMSPSPPSARAPRQARIARPLRRQQPNTRRSQ